MCDDLHIIYPKKLYDKQSTVNLNDYASNNQVMTLNEHYNIGHFFVSNTSPNIWKNKNSNNFAIANIPDESELKYEYETDTEYQTGLKFNQQWMKKWKDVGQVYTDLWWITIVDYKQYVQLIENKLNELTEDADYASEWTTEFHVDDDVLLLDNNVKNNIDKRRDFYRNTIVNRVVNAKVVDAKIGWYALKYVGSGYCTDYEIIYDGCCVGSYFADMEYQDEA
jgi:hypothetical protein